MVAQPQHAQPPSPSRFAPADLSQRLSATPQRPQNPRPYGYQAPAMGRYQNPQINQQLNSGTYFGHPQGYAQGYTQGSPQGYSRNAPPNFGGYGGYGPPIIGNNSWGGAPDNNFFPYGF